MNKLLISIIIPIYNVEPYIVRCIESVLNQTYRHLEIILIDDCSPDCSIELAKDCIANSTLSKELHFVYLKHDHNRGLSAARNTGIAAATGEYVYFMDSDDEIFPYSIERLVALAVKYPGVDIVQGNFRATEEHYKQFVFKKEDVPEYTDKKDWIEQNFRAYGWSGYGNIPVMAWNKLMNRKFIVDNELWFKESLIFEDEYWRLMNYDKINSISFCPDETYIYHTNSTSIIKSADNMINKWISVLTILCDYSMTLKSSESAQSQYLVLSLYEKYKEYYNTLSSWTQKWTFIQFVFKIIEKSRIKLRYKIALLYLMFPKCLIRKTFLDYIVTHRFRTNSN